VGDLNPKSKDDLAWLTRDYNKIINHLLACSTKQHKSRRTCATLIINLQNLLVDDVSYAQFSHPDYVEFYTHNLRRHHLKLVYESVQPSCLRHDAPLHALPFAVPSPYATDDALMLRLSPSLSSLGAADNHQSVQLHQTKHRDL
jgi:hypothetical protein